MSLDIKEKYRAAVDAIDRQDLPELTRALTALGAANIDTAINKEGHTLLMYAASQGKLEASLVLLEHGSDPGITNHNNQSALHMVPGRIEIYDKSLQETQYTFNVFLRDALINYGADLTNYAGTDKAGLYSARGLDFTAEGLKPSKEEIIKKYTHLLGLKGFINGIQGEGGDFGRAIRWLADSQNAYINHLKKSQPDSESLKIYEKIADAFQVKNTSNAASIEKLIDRYNNDELTVLSTGWSGHSVTVVLYKDYVILTNRGEHATNPIGSQIYQIPDKAKVPDFITRMKASHFASYGTTGKYEDFKTAFEQVAGKLVGVIPHKLQKTGTCSFVNAKSAESGCIAVLLADEALNNQQEVNFIDIQKKAKAIYKPRTRFMREQAIKEMVSDPDVVKHMDKPQGMHAAILEKLSKSTKPDLFLQMIDSTPNSLPDYKGIIYSMFMSSDITNLTMRKAYLKHLGAPGYDDFAGDMGAYAVEASKIDNVAAVKAYFLIAENPANSRYNDDVVKLYSTAIANNSKDTLQYLYDHCDLKNPVYHLFTLPAETELTAKKTYLQHLGDPGYDHFSGDLDAYVIEAGKMDNMAAVKAYVTITGPFRNIHENDTILRLYATALLSDAKEIIQYLNENIDLKDPISRIFRWPDTSDLSLRKYLLNALGDSSYKNFTGDIEAHAIEASTANNLETVKICLSLLDADVITENSLNMIIKLYIVALTNHSVDIVNHFHERFDQVLSVEKLIPKVVSSRNYSFIEKQVALLSNTEFSAKYLKRNSSLYNSIVKELSQSDQPKLFLLLADNPPDNNSELKKIVYSMFVSPDTTDLTMRKAYLQHAGDPHYKSFTGDLEAYALNAIKTDNIAAVKAYLSIAYPDQNSQEYSEILSKLCIAALTEKSTKTLHYLDELCSLPSSIEALVMKAMASENYSPDEKRAALNSLAELQESNGPVLPNNLLTLDNINEFLSLALDQNALSLASYLIDNKNAGDVNALCSALSGMITRPDDQSEYRQLIEKMLDNTQITIPLNGVLSKNGDDLRLLALQTNDLSLVERILPKNISTPGYETFDWNPDADMLESLAAPSNSSPAYEALDWNLDSPLNENTPASPIPLPTVTSFDSAVSPDELLDKALEQTVNEDILVHLATVYGGNYETFSHATQKGYHQVAIAILNHEMIDNPAPRITAETISKKSLALFLNPEDYQSRIDVVNRLSDLGIPIKTPSFASAVKDRSKVVSLDAVIPGYSPDMLAVFKMLTDGDQLVKALLSLNKNQVEPILRGLGKEKLHDMIKSTDQLNKVLEMLPDNQRESIRLLIGDKAEVSFKKNF